MKPIKSNGTIMDFNERNCLIGLKNTISRNRVIKISRKKAISIGLKYCTNIAPNIKLLPQHITQKRRPM